MKTKDINALALLILDRIGKDNCLAGLFFQRGAVSCEQLRLLPSPKKIRLMEWVASHPSGLIMVAWIFTIAVFYRLFTPSESWTFLVGVGTLLFSLIPSYLFSSWLVKRLDGYKDIVQKADEVSCDRSWFDYIARSNGGPEFTNTEGLRSFLNELIFRKVSAEHAGLLDGGMDHTIRAYSHTLKRYGLTDGNLTPIFASAEARWIEEVNSGKIQYPTDFQI